MDPAEATRRNIPWCAYCEGTDGPWFYVEDMILVCAGCVKDKGFEDAKPISSSSE